MTTTSDKKKKKHNNNGPKVKPTEKLSDLEVAAGLVGISRARNGTANDPRSPIDDRSSTKNHKNDDAWTDQRTPCAIFIHFSPNFSVLSSRLYICPYIYTYIDNTKPTSS